MLAYRTQLLRRTGRPVLHSILWQQSRSYQLPPHGSVAYQTLVKHVPEVEQLYEEAKRIHEAKRQPKAILWKCLKVLILTYAGYKTLSFGFRCVTRNDICGAFASSTIFHLVPPKRIGALNVANDTLYQPITQDKEIRLLALEPGAAGDELKCHLINVQLSWRTTYEALSYCWGDPTVTRQLNCSGQIVDVTTSLHDALSDLRHPTCKRLLWVDALCINQADNDEKSKQIRLMGEIYSQARQVLIYLGRSDHSVEGALESISLLDKKFRPLYFKGPFLLKNMGPARGVLIDTLLRKKPFSEDEIDWDRILRLLSRPWFQRTWVVQEAVLSKRAQVICGDQSIPWFTLVRVMAGMVIYGQAGGKIPGFGSFARTMECMMAIQSARMSANINNVLLLPQRLRSSFFGGPPIHGDRGPSLLELVLKSRIFACTDPRDRIFAMLGMTSQDTTSKYLTANYLASPGDVFRNFVLWEIYHNHSLQVLSTSSNRTKGQHTSPSWVPHFDSLDLHENLTGFDASAGLPIQARTSNGDTVLHLNGRIIDTIHTVGKKSINDAHDLITSGWKEPDDRSAIYHRLRLVESTVKEARDIWLAAMKRKTGGAVPRASSIHAKRGEDGKLVQEYEIPPHWEPFLRTLACGKSIRGKKIEHDDLACMLWFVRLAVEDHQLPRDLFVRALARKALGVFLSQTKSRCFAGTTTGLAGYVPMRAKKGDLVVILHGAKVPFVLRKGWRGTYSLVGECYMDGIMHGEGLKGAGAKGADVEFAIV